MVSVQSNDNGCKSMLVTPDEKTIVCGVESWGGASASCPVVRPGVAEYSAATGELLRVLYEDEGNFRSAKPAALFQLMNDLAPAVF